MSIFLQDVESKAKVHPLVQGDDEIKGEQPNTDAPLGDSYSLSAASNDNKRVSREDIELVRWLVFSIMEAMLKSV